MILSICMDYLLVRNARKTIFRVRQAVREEHSLPLNLWRVWPCPSVWTTCTTIFKSSARADILELIRRYAGPRGFSWNFSSRKGKRADIARWQRVAKRRGERGFFSLSSSLLDSLSQLGGSLSLSQKKIARKISETRSSSPLIDTVICSFPAIASTTTNFHFVNGLVRHVPIS